MARSTPGTTGSRSLNDQFIKAVSDWQKSDGDEKAKSKVLEDRRAPDQGDRRHRSRSSRATRTTSAGSPMASRGSTAASATTFAARPSIPSTPSGSSFMRTFFPFSAVLETSEERRWRTPRSGRVFVRDVARSRGRRRGRYGGKASGLSRMMSAGVPAPPAFVIGAEGFHHFRSNGEKVGDGS